MNTAILDVRQPAALAQDDFRHSDDLVRVLALDRLAETRRTLACHWHRDADGRLVCAWAPDLGACRLVDRHDLT
jgi:hypothetical protein